MGVNPPYLPPLTLTLSPRGEGIKGCHSSPCNARGILAIFVKCEMTNDKCALRIVPLPAVSCQLD